MMSGSSFAFQVKETTVLCTVAANDEGDAGGTRRSILDEGLADAAVNGPTRQSPRSGRSAVRLGRPVGRCGGVSCGAHLYWVVKLCLLNEPQPQNDAVCVAAKRVTARQREPVPGAEVAVLPYHAEI